MDLHQCIEFIRDQEKEFVLFNLGPDDAVAADLADFFASQNVRIRSARTASGEPADVAVLSDAEDVLAVVDVATLRGMIDQPPTDEGVGIRDAAYEPVLAHLKETTFTSYEKSQLLAASREMEDRAARVGRGTIHAGFQRLSRMAEQAETYRHLATRGVAVHAYGVPDAPPPDLGPGRVHAVETDEIADSWFVVFDGGGDATQKSALIAEQRGEDSFYGAWTYDPAMVEHVLDHLEGRYVSPADDQRHQPDR